MNTVELNWLKVSQRKLIYLLIIEMDVLLLRLYKLVQKVCENSDETSV